MVRAELERAIHQSKEWVDNAGNASGHDLDQKRGNHDARVIHRVFVAPRCSFFGGITGHWDKVSMFARYVR